MSAKDTITKEYMSDPVIFADAFNHFLYRGKQKIKPECLKELDTSEITIPYDKDGIPLPEQKSRDVLKLLTAKTDGHTAYCILGVENQSEIHYAAPVKNGTYDFLNLSHQVSEIAKAHRRHKGEHRPTPAEYLSGFWKDDKLIPVVTLMVYFGPEEWDGPLSLREMYSCSEAEILDRAPDYHVNLIAPAKLSGSQFNEFKSSLREVLLYIKYSEDGNRLAELLKNDDRFKAVERQAADVIGVMTNSKFEYPGGKEELVDMCKGLQQIQDKCFANGKAAGIAEGKAAGMAAGIAEGRAAGIAEGKAAGMAAGIAEGRAAGKTEGISIGEIMGAVGTYKDIGLSLADTTANIVRRFCLPHEEAKKVVRQYWN